MPDNVPNFGDHKNMTTASHSKSSKTKKSGKKRFEPKILALCCNWCSYAGADLAGTSRLTVPPNLRVIRVNCTGRIDPMFILQALEGGADGVLISGCHEGDCHYSEGNIHSKRRFDFFKKILDEMGIGNRIEFVHVSAAEGEKWRDVNIQFIEHIRKLGPTPIQDTANPTKLVLDDEHSRKGIIRELLISIANRLDYTQKKPLSFDPDEVVDGYGFPKRDPDKCIGCFACYSICPENAIKIEDVKKKRKYGTIHAHCLVCKECEKICPKEAITISPGFELLSFLYNEPVWEFDLPLRACSVCKEYYNASAFGDELKEVVSNKVGNEKLEEMGMPYNPFTTCPDCKRQVMTQTYVHIAQPKMKRSSKKT
jgi:coenzyme F420-reducing hydrogenase delta subunit/formate hydrogenlyase subunit 6/NADH:ubiquinone oxidoreductase subunit I